MNDSREENGAGVTSDHLEEYLRILKVDGTPHSVRAERMAFAAMRSEIKLEKDKNLRRFMGDTVLDCCNGGSMLLSYLHENIWKESIQEQKSIRRQMRPIELYIAIESIMAVQSDSSGYTKFNSYDRYPLTLPGNTSGDKGSKRVRHLDKDVSPSQLLKSRYQFGVHTFFVGRAIRHVIQYLENRYGLDFEKLERAHHDASGS